MDSAEVVPSMKELDVDAMESFGENTDLAGPVMDNVNRAGERQCVCVCVCVWRSLLFQ